NWITPAVNPRVARPAPPSDRDTSVQRVQYGRVIPRGDHSLVVSLAQSGLLAGCIPPSLLVSSELSELDGVELGSLGDVEDGCSDSDGVTDSLGVPLSDESVLGSQSEPEPDVAASSGLDTVSGGVSVPRL